ncbi:hypothetical protein G6L37_35125 [Agrobacterium rubi]|nr:hypothetical protein [Agrobacterium rubi]NTF23803.1 hypothetical protein [Agrobacterium rubi]
MSARRSHLKSMIPELDEMREAVAATARGEYNGISHRAYMKQAQSLRSIYAQITSTWHNVAQEVHAERGESLPDVVELRYAERVSGWLREHARKTGELTEGGDLDLVNASSSMGRSDLAIIRLYASRHYEMVADYCERSAAVLDARAGELRDPSLPRP